MSQIDLKELTKKNQEFIHIATQQFLKDGKTDAEIKAILEEVIPHILEEQPKGVTARSIYGAPTHWAHSFSEKEQYEKEHPKENDDPKLMMLDSALFITGLFAVVSALMSFFSNQPVAYGLVTLISVGAFGGVAFYLLYHFIYRYYGPDTDRSTFGYVSNYVCMGSHSLLEQLPSTSHQHQPPTTCFIGDWRSSPCPTFLPQKTFQHQECKCRTC